MKANPNTFHSKAQRLVLSGKDTDETNSLIADLCWEMFPFDNYPNQCVVLYAFTLNSYHPVATSRLR